MQLGGLEGAAGARLAAIRDAFAGMISGRLPPHMLFSDRDFDANDYEALLALDDGVQSKGAALAALQHPLLCHAHLLSIARWLSSAPVPKPP